ncbi:hypothetical protein DL96DRAFT_1605764 [Flagelloscypha sp. PMI_526]|nr:hypothetical protein DL96DRAFT_1605764 [Flagelloscypha sp. PMI_526]
MDSESHSQSSPSRPQQHGSSSDEKSTTSSIIAPTIAKGLSAVPEEDDLKTQDNVNHHPQPDRSPPTPPPKARSDSATPPPKARPNSAPPTSDRDNLFQQFQEELLAETRAFHQSALESVEHTRQGVEERLRALPGAALASARRDSEVLLQRGISAGTASLRRGLHGALSDEHPYRPAPTRTQSLGVHGASTDEHPYQPAPIRTQSLGLVDDRTTRSPAHSRSGLGLGNPLEWVVPVHSKFKSLTVGEKLEMTIAQAEVEMIKAQGRAKITGMAVNICIGLQVLLGALTTALSSVTVGKQTNVMTSVTGGFATVVATMLAKLKGMGEPETSKERHKDISSFIRDCKAYQTDFGPAPSEEHKEAMDDFRGRLEELLGNRTISNRQRPQAGRQKAPSSHV